MKKFFALLLLLLFVASTIVFSETNYKNGKASKVTKSWLSSILAK